MNLAIFCNWADSAPLSLATLDAERWLVDVRLLASGPFLLDLTDLPYHSA